MRGNHTLMFLSLFFLPFPSLKINKYFLKKGRKRPPLAEFGNIIKGYPLLPTKASKNSSALERTGGVQESGRGKEG